MGACPPQRVKAAKAHRGILEPRAFVSGRPTVQRGAPGHRWPFRRRSPCARYLSHSRNARVEALSVRSWAAVHSRIGAAEKSELSSREPLIIRSWEATFVQGCSASPGSIPARRPYLPTPEWRTAPCCRRPSEFRIRRM